MWIYNPAIFSFFHLTLNYFFSDLSYWTCQIYIMKMNINMVTTSKDYRLCLEIRRKVFVQEQNINENLENDDHIIDANYIIAFKELLPVGTARYRKTNLGIKLERFAVLKEYRYLGVGKSMLKYLLNKLIKEKKSILILKRK